MSGLQLFLFPILILDVSGGHMVVSVFSSYLFFSSLVSGFSQVRSQPLILDPQRRKLISEFLLSMKTTEASGYLYSGPHGMGKSGLCFTTFLICYVRRMLVVHFSSGYYGLNFQTMI
jgi:hypothetical protein